jgi:hypothetical protein
VYVEERAHGAQMIGALKQLGAGRKAEDVAPDVAGVEAHDRCLERDGGIDVSQKQEAKRLFLEHYKAA